MIALDARNITAGYAGRTIISDVCIRAIRGEIALVVGVNGSGKSTLLKAVFGLHPMKRGEVEVSGHGLLRPFPRTLYGFGVSYWPQGMQVFEDLKVYEHLEIAARAMTREARSRRITACFEKFPGLAAKRGLVASSLSGGEKQTLAVATAICSGNQVMLLDEPCLGLSFTASQDILRHLRRLADAGEVGIVLVEHRIREALLVADTVYALKNGVASFSGSAKPFQDPEGVERLTLLI